MVISTMISHMLADQNQNPYMGPSELVQTYPLLFPVMSPVYPSQYPQKDIDPGFPCL